MDKVKCIALKKALRSNKRTEKSRFTVSPDFIKEEEDEEGMTELLGSTSWDRTKSFVMDIEIVKLIKVEDWYNDRKAVMRTLRRGKGRSPYTDSLIYFRIMIEVNGEKVFSNYQASELPIEEQEDYKQLTLE